MLVVALPTDTSPTILGGSMRRTLIATTVVLALAGCGSASSTGSVSDEEIGASVLQQFDSGNGNGGQDVGAYRGELDILAGKCTNPTKDMARFIENTYNLEVQAGITDETALSLLQHLDQSLPVGVQTDCQSALATYLTMREG